MTRSPSGKSDADPLLALLTGDETAVADIGIASSPVIIDEAVQCGEAMKKAKQKSEADLLTPSQAAKTLSISVRTLSRLTTSGHVPHLRIGRRLVRYSRSALSDWIDRRMRRGRTRN